VSRCRRISRWPCLDFRKTERLHEPVCRGLGVLRGLDEGNDGVDVVECRDEPLEDVGPLACLVELEERPAGDDDLAEGDVALEHVLEVHDPRLAGVDGEHADPEGVLHLGVFEELVEDDAGDLVALEVDDDADTVAVRLVAQIGDPLDLALLHEIGDLLDEARLVDEVGKLGDDDALAVCAVGALHHGPRPDAHGAPSRAVGREDPVAAVDKAGRGEVRPLDVLHEPLDGDLRVADEGNRSVDDLSQVVGRDVGGNADGDPGGAVQKQHREPRGHHRGLLHGAVVVGHKVDGVLLEVLQELFGNARHPDLGVSHGRRRVAVDGAEVALPVDQRVAERKVLGHAHDRVVGGGVSVGMVLTDDIADDAGRFLVGPVPAVAHLVHGKERSTVDGLEPVAHIRYGTPDDDAHGVVHVGLLHLVFDVHRDVFLIKLHVKKLSLGNKIPPYQGGTKIVGIRASGFRTRDF
jgi:hypothetical protein